jgi:hypothetical protein
MAAKRYFYSVQNVGEGCGKITVAEAKKLAKKLDKEIHLSLNGKCEDAIVTVDGRTLRW